MWFKVRRKFKPAANTAKGWQRSENVPSIAAPVPGADGKLPDWIEILQAGQILDTVDGRQYENHDPDALVKLLNSRAGKGMDLHMDPHHQSTDAGSNNGVVGALAWMDKFENRNGAVWAHVKEYTQDVPEVNSMGGQTAFSKRLLRYISPVVWHDGNGKIFDIESIAGTNTPNMFLRAVAGRQGANTMDPMQLMQELIKLYGLSGDATPEQVLAAAQADAGDDPANAQAVEAGANALAKTLGTDANAKDLPALLTSANARIVKDGTKVTEHSALAQKVADLEKQANDRAVNEKKARVDSLLEKHSKKIKPGQDANARALAEANPEAFDAIYADAADILPGEDPTAGRSFNAGKAPDADTLLSDEHLQRVSSMSREHQAAQKKLGINVSLPQAVKWANAELEKQARAAKPGAKK